MTKWLSKGSPTSSWQSHRSSFWAINMIKRWLRTRKVALTKFPYMTSWIQSHPSKERVLLLNYSLASPRPQTSKRGFFLACSSPTKASRRNQLPLRQANSPIQMLNKPDYSANSSRSSKEQSSSKSAFLKLLMSCSQLRPLLTPFSTSITISKFATSMSIKVKNLHMQIMALTSLRTQRSWEESTLSSV